MAWKRRTKILHPNKYLHKKDLLTEVFDDLIQLNQLKKKPEEAAAIVINT
jgi:hypothetical protein